MSELPIKSMQPEILAAAPRCLAMTRKGSACQSPKVKGKKRCRMHGGAKGSGAPVGNRNAWKHGGRSGEHLEQIRRFREVLAGARAVADVL